MNIHQVHPNLKAFLFFILVLVCGIFSMILALYFEKIFPTNNEHKGISTYPTEALRASFGGFTGFENSPNHSGESSLSGTIVPPSTAIISLISLTGDETVKGTANENGDLLINEIKPGDYEIIISPAPESGLAQKKIDVLSIQPNISRKMGIVELQEYNLVSRQE